MPEVLRRTAAAADDSASAAGGRAIAKSCIMIWLDGGPSHIDTWDPKPEAPREVRGPFEAIATRVPGVRISELFPRLATKLDQVALLRSLTSPLGEHNLGAQYLLTGYRPSPVIEYPSLVSTIAAQLSGSAGGVGRGRGVLPQSVAVPNFRVGGGALKPEGFLPAQFAPFAVQADPAEADFAVRHLNWSEGTEKRGDTSRRLERRRAFRRRFDGDQRLDPLTQQAFDLLGSSKARRAFAIDREPAPLRDRYGRRTLGQSCLLARRLVEAGVPLVSVINHGWDTHLDLVTRLKDGFTGAKNPVGLGPSLDRALTTLIEDLQQRGLWDETLVIVMGEFGRTPRWNAAGGRDHWPRVFSVLLAGGPVQGGAVIGSSDRHGESPADRPITPADLAHTVYTAMGIDPSAVVETDDGRPISLADRNGQVISGVLA
jgi:hypothetical protein